MTSLPDIERVPDNKVHGATMGPTWVLSAPDGPHVGPMNLAIRGVLRAGQPVTVETLYSTIYYSKYFIELNFYKSTQYVAF